MNHIASLYHLDNIERYLLLAIAITGIVLFFVLLTLLFRYISSQKQIKQMRRIHQLNRLKKVTQNKMQNFPSEMPVFFGMPNPSDPEAQWANGVDLAADLRGDLKADLTLDEHFFMESSSVESSSVETSSVKSSVGSSVVKSSVETSLEFSLEDDHALIDKVMQHGAGFLSPTPEPMPYPHNSESSEMSLKLNLAQIYIEIEDKQNAILLLEEVLKEGEALEKEQANKMLTALSNH